MIFPGVVAIFSPRRKAFMSVIVIESRPLPRSRSTRRFSKPRSKFCPPESRVAARTSGFVAPKLEGDKASTNWRVGESSPRERGALEAWAASHVDQKALGATAQTVF